MNSRKAVSPGKRDRNKPPVYQCVSYAGAACAVTLFVTLLEGCSGSITSQAVPTAGPQLYMAPIVNSGSPSLPSTFSIDDEARTFAQQTYSVSGDQSGSKILYSGKLAYPGLARGLEELDLTYACGGGPNCIPPTPYTPPNGWAVELPDQAGGLSQLQGQPFVPLVPAVTCPSMSTPETFLFVTLPAPLIAAGTVTALHTWNPKVETAYGSVDVSGSGSTVTLANIKQFLLPSVGGGTPATAPTSSQTGACSQTPYGNTIAIPASPIVTDPIAGSPSSTPQAVTGIGPSGMLVEDNGSSLGGGKPPYYENTLGAGTGAIGLTKPSSAVDPHALAGFQYLGFFYGSGSSGSTTNWSSSPASFGFSSQPSTCAVVAPSTSTMLYGGDFPGNNPSASTVQSNGGFGNCDFAIDLGAQDASTNGLFPNAIVYVGSGFGGNATKHNFPAVAIAGQLSGKNAIFVIGEDLLGSPNQAWGIYLLQSN